MESVLAFCAKQLTLARQVHVVYEAGAFGFWVCRKLKDMGVNCFGVHPEKLDPRNKRVQTDRLDSWHLANKLQRYVQGNSYYNQIRVHQSLEGAIPEEKAGRATTPPLDLRAYRWQAHCHGLFELPIAA